MRDLLRKKVRSESGASITFALLLFLVCATVGSIVLVAGTAASGRLSGLRTSDQAYYSVSSASGLLLEVMKNKSEGSEYSKPVTVKQTETKTAGAVPVVVYGSDSDESLLKHITETHWNYNTYHTDPTKNYIGKTLSLSVEAIDSLNLDVLEKIYENGDVDFIISKGSTEDTYSLELKYKADIALEEEVQEDTDTTITTAKYRWFLNEINVL